jgi:hypothetical protein
MKNYLFIVLAAGLMGAIASCTPAPSDPDSPDASQSAPTEQSVAEETTPEEPEENASEPDPSAQANLETYDETATGIPVITQYPADTMEVMSTGSGEGVGVFFTFKPTDTHMDEANVHVFLPSGVTSGEELEPFITGENGLLENNGWILDNAANIEDSPYADDLSYPWVERVLAFSTDMEESGVILLGEREGQAVQVTLFYPAEMMDTYWPNAMTILDNLTFDADLLPLTASEGL